MHLSTFKYMTGSMRNFAANLAHRLGKRIDIRTNKFIEMNVHLRSLLPTADKGDIKVRIYFSANHALPNALDRWFHSFCLCANFIIENMSFVLGQV